MKTIFKKLSVIIAVFILFVSCSSDSGDTPCVPISCLNGGTSTADCGCDCPQGFIGNDCGTQVTPTQVKITKIRVTKFPDTNNGNYWDNFPNSDADIYVTIQNSSSVTIFDSPTYFENATSNGVNYYDFVPTSPIIIANAISPYYMYIYDFDAVGSDELMDFYVFNPYSSTGGFPTTKTFTNSASTFSFQLTLEYVW
jgi:hypothetical protein